MRLNFIQKLFCKQISHNLSNNDENLDTLEPLTFSQFKNDWILDSRANSHFLGNYLVFNEIYHLYSATIISVGGHFHIIVEQGSIDLSLPNRKIKSLKAIC